LEVAREKELMGIPVSSRVCGNDSQGEIWAIEAERRFRRLLADVMKRSGLSRAAIAKEISQILGRPVRKQTFDDFVRSRKKGCPFRFPAAWVPALCQVIKNDELQRHLLSDRLLELLSIGESIADSALPLKRAYEAVTKLAKQKRQSAGRSKR
jgi:hypothetical protein